MEKEVYTTKGSGSMGTGGPSKQTNVDPSLVPYTKIYSKCKPIELLEDTIGENLCGLTLGKYFFDTMLKA